MFLKLLKKGYCILKQVLHIMQVQKYGEISHMITNQIFGLSVAYYMNL